MRSCPRIGRHRRSVLVGFVLGAGNFLHNGGGPFLADFAIRVVNAALREREFAAAVAGFCIEFVESGGELLRSESRCIHAGQHGSAVGVFQENFAGILESFHFGGNGQIEERAHFGFVQSGIGQSHVLLDDAAVGSITKTVGSAAIPP